jgi:ATP-dependent DNA helicase RecG
MEWPEVQRRIRDGEDDSTELKRGVGDGKAVRSALAAFANTRGGVLILGVDDDRTVVGVQEDPEKVAERLTDLLQTGLNAPVQARLGRFEDPSGWVHWIEVPRQRGFEPLRARGRVWVRRGRSTVEPSASELQDLYNLFGYILTETRAIEAAGETDIDVEVFRRFLATFGLDVEEEPQPAVADDLLNRGVLAEVGGELHATLYGVLAFGRTPQAYPQTQSFWVEGVVYAGRDRADDVLAVGEGRGRLDEQVERAVSWLRILGRQERYEGLYRQDVPPVPEKAIREALVNAVAHRDYAILGSKVLLEVFADRIVVTSPGTLPNHMTLDSVRAGGQPRSRNELIANFLLARRLMESRGRGWPLMRRLMREHNGTEPELVEDRGGRFVRVTFLTRPNGRREKGYTESSTSPP